MEKREFSPPSRFAYSDLVNVNHETVIVGGTGASFIMGTVGGSLYHLMKHKQLTPALAYGPRIGGFVALYNLSTAITRSALYNHRGGVRTKFDEMVSYATGAAIMWSPRGLRTASKAASIFAGAYIFMDWEMEWCTRERERIMAKNNPN